MSEGSRIQFPHRSPDALRSLARRLGVAVGIIVVIAVLTWLGRNGYSDADGTPVSLLDAFYYATVTATTTGYGDIAPLHPYARGLANVEAIIGQIYPATLLARLVTLEITHDQKP